MNSSRVIVAVDGRSRPSRCAGVRARSKRPLLAMTTRSVMSRSTGLAGRWNVPQAHDPPAARPFHQITSPRSSRPRSWRIGRHVAGQRAVRAAAEVGDVDGDAPARLEHPLALGEHVAQQLQVLEVGGRHAVDAEARARTACRRSTAATSRRGRPSRRAPAAIARASWWWMTSTAAGRATVGVGGDLGRDEAVVERRRVVRLAPARPELGGGGGTPGARGHAVSRRITHAADRYRLPPHDTG